MTLCRLPPALLFLSAAACVSGPFNNTTLSGTGEAVKFQGYTFTPGGTVEIQASTSPSGPFSTIATAVAQTNPYTYPDGFKVYYFTTTSAVPFPNWQGDDCVGRQTYIRVMTTSGVNLPTLDETAPNGKPVFTCIQDEVNNGVPTVTAIFKCDSPESPVLRLNTQANTTKPTQHTGNITIATAADEDQWACLEQLNGNLTIPKLGPDDVTLNYLTQVTGDVTVTYDRFVVPSSGGVEGSYELHAPALQTIGGDFVATSPLIGPPGPQSAVILGLDGLQTLQGDLRVQVDTFNMQLTGMAGLTVVGGDLVVDGGGGDATMSGFLPALTDVNGDVELTVGNNLFGLLPTLQRIGGDLRHLDGNIFATGSTQDGYAGLIEVTGDLQLENAMVFGPPGSFSVLQSLTLVGGELTYRQVGNPNALRIGATGGLSVGSLRVEGNFSLQQFGATNMSVAPSGPITVINNPNLCTSTINAFTAGQPGWTGTLTQTGNNTGC